MTYDEYVEYGESMQEILQNEEASHHIYCDNCHEEIEIGAEFFDCERTTLCPYCQEKFLHQVSDLLNEKSSFASNYVVDFAYDALCDVFNNVSKIWDGNY